MIIVGKTQKTREKITYWREKKTYSVGKGGNVWANVPGMQPCPERANAPEHAATPEQRTAPSTQTCLHARVPAGE